MSVFEKILSGANIFWSTEKDKLNNNFEKCAKAEGDGQNLTGHKLIGYTENAVNHGTIAASQTVTMKWSEGPAHIITLNGADILVQTDAINETTTDNASKTIHLYGCNTYTPTFPAGWISDEDFPEELTKYHIRLELEYINDYIFLSYSGGFDV